MKVDTISGVAGQEIFDRHRERHEIGRLTQVEIEYPYQQHNYQTSDLFEDDFPHLKCHETIHLTKYGNRICYMLKYSTSNISKDNFKIF